MWIRSRGEATILTCRVHPGAPRTGIDSVKDDHLVIRLTSPPVEGKANQALIKFIAKQLRLAQSKISIVQGDTSRIKVLSIEGVNPETVAQRLGIETES